MTISREAAATRAVIQQHREEIFSGGFTTEEVIQRVQAVLPGAERESIFLYIQTYGPTGENDLVWKRRVDRPSPIPEWFKTVEVS